MPKTVGQKALSSYVKGATSNSTRVRHTAQSASVSAQKSGTGTPTPSAQRRATRTAIKTGLRKSHPNMTAVEIRNTAAKQTRALMKKK